MDFLARIAAPVMLLLATLAAGKAEARDRHYNNYDRYDDIRDDRRDARRAGIVAGAVTYGVVRTVQTDRQYQDREYCLRETGDYAYCERLEYRDNQQDRREARRTAVTVGVVTGSVVRSNRRHDRWH